MHFSIIRKSILALLADGQFHSGADLSKSLGISRTAIWKQLNFLKALGLDFSAVSGKGYRLDKPLELLEREIILAILKPAVAKRLNNFYIHDSLTSTNTFLFEQTEPVGAEVCLAEFQSAGKGRRGRQWVSPFGSNIYLSISWRYQQGPAAVSGLSLATGVAVVRALRRMAFNDVGLKWPNDVYWQQKKLGGILVEVRGDAEGPCTVVVGIGLNVDLSVDDAVDIDQPWVDLKQINNIEGPIRNQLVASILDELIPIMADFDETGITPFVDEWRTYDCMCDKLVTLSVGAQKITGIVRGINEQGLINLQQIDGNIVAYASGEVTFRTDQ